MLRSIGLKNGKHIIRSFSIIRAKHRLYHQGNVCIKDIGVLPYANMVLSTSDPMKKAALSIDAFNKVKHFSPSSPRELEQWLGTHQVAPDMPSRPQYPELKKPQEMPNHKSLQVSNTDFLLHGLAHIELNAIDTCWDTIARFSHVDMPYIYYIDFMSIASDESRHFKMLCERLQARGCHYGFIPAHDGIWQNAERTKTNLKARIAAIQLVQESRALDSWDRLVHKLKSQGDKESSKLVNLICEEEIDHVTKGVKWFTYLCELENLDTITTFHHLVKEYTGIIPPPFNTLARAKAGMTEEWYIPISRK